MTWQQDMISGEKYNLPDDVRDKYQAYNGGHFAKLIITYLEQLIDEVKELKDRVEQL